MLWVYDLKRNAIRAQKPENTGAENNFYSVKDVHGSYIDELDRWLEGVEAKAATPYEKLLRAEELGDQERADFSTFVASLYVRSPSIIEAAAEVSGQMAQALTNAKWSTREQFEKNLDEHDAKFGSTNISRDDLWGFYNDKNAYGIRVERSRGLSVMGASDTIQTILFDRNWYVIAVDEDFFISSDSPVARWCPPGDTGFLGDGGFLNPKCEVTLPLSPSRALLICDRVYDGFKLRAPASTVRRLNELRAFAATRHLYSHVRSAAVAELAKRFKDTRFRWTMEGGGPFADVEVVARMPRTLD